MTPHEQRALLAVALLAAFADGDKSDAERDEVKRIADTLGAQSASLNTAELMQDVLLKRLTVAQAVADLTAPEHRQLAYELAVCVCDADGVQSAAERQFLAALKSELGSGLDAGFEAQANGLAVLTDSPHSAGVPVLDMAALDKSILNHAILCGALELLPQSWATLAIIPLQVKLVYGVGKAQGVSLDQGHIKEFIATAGVGMTSQYLEQFGRKLLGGVLGMLAGGLGRGLGSAGTGMAMSFATTYALGQLALRYYGGGRQMSTALLRETYEELLGSAKHLQAQVLPQIQQRARSLDAGKVLELVRQPLA